MQASDLLELYGLSGDGQSLEYFETILDTGTLPGGSISSLDFATDTQGNAHVAWLTGVTVGFTYHHSPWHTEIVDDSVTVEGDISLAVDSLDRVHLTYYDAGAGELVYALGTPIPEPGTLLLLGAGIGTLAAVRRHRKKRTRNPCT